MGVRRRRTELRSRRDGLGETGMNYFRNNDLSGAWVRLHRILQKRTIAEAVLPDAAWDCFAISGRQE